VTSVTVSAQTDGRSPRRLSLAIGVRKHDHNPHHRRPEISSLEVLDAPSIAGCGRLMRTIQMCVKSAVEDKCTGVLKAKHERSRSPTVAVSALQEVVRAVMSSRIEEVITHDGVIVRVAIDPPDRISSVNRHREGRKSILLGNDHLLLYRMVVGTDAVRACDQGQGHHHDHGDAFREFMHSHAFLSSPHEVQFAGHFTARLAAGMQAG
jgi:hypothetical protein